MSFCRHILFIQNEKNGIDRPKLFYVERSKERDQISVDVEELATYLSSLIEPIPIKAELAKIGRRLVSEGKVSVEGGGCYANQVLSYIHSNI